jgi:hypothetical protein
MTVPQLLKAIQRDGGYARATRGERFLLGAYAVFLLSVAVALVVWSYQRLLDHPPGGYLPLAAFGFAFPTCFVAIAVVLGRRCFMEVVFTATSVTCYGVLGRPIWIEGLAGLIEIRHILGARGPGAVKLIWPHKVRAIPFDAWWEGLLDREFARAEREEMARVEQAYDREHPRWKCDECAEDNPGEFELCWSCGRGKSQ